MISDVITTKVIEDSFLVRRFVYNATAVANIKNVGGILRVLTQPHRSLRDAIVIGEEDNSIYWVLHLYRGRGWSEDLRPWGISDITSKGGFYLARRAMPYRDDPFWDSLSPEDKLCDILDSLTKR